MTQRPDAAQQPRRFYVESVSVPVHMGSTSGKHEPMSQFIAKTEALGWRLDQMTSVYAEKLGVNCVIHTLFFRSVSAPPPTPIGESE